MFVLDNSGEDIFFVLL